MHAIECRKGEIAFQFTDEHIIQKIYVSSLIQKQLSKGILAIAKSPDGYKVIPKVIAEKIKQ